MTNKELIAEIDRLISEAKKVSQIEISTRIDGKRKDMALGKIIAYEHVKSILR